MNTLCQICMLSGRRLHTRNMSICCTEDEMLSPDLKNDSPRLFDFLSFSNSAVPLIVETISVGGFPHIRFR